MRTDGQTDMMKLIVAFHNFVNMPKNGARYTEREEMRQDCVDATRKQNYFCVPSHSSSLVAGRAWVVGKGVWWSQYWRKTNCLHLQ